MRVKFGFPLPHLFKMALVASVESFSTKTKAASSNSQRKRSTLRKTAGRCCAQFFTHPANTARFGAVAVIIDCPLGISAEHNSFGTATISRGLRLRLLTRLRIKQVIADLGGAH